MEYTVSATDLANIQLNEEDRVKEILRNVAVILATPKGSVPMYRSFGLDMSFLDKPMNIAKNLAVIPVREAIEEWEPRAIYKDMTLFFDPSNPGKLAFTVQIEIKEAVEVSTQLAANCVESFFRDFVRGFGKGGLFGGRDFAGFATLSATSGDRAADCNQKADKRKRLYKFFHCTMAPSNPLKYVRYYHKWDIATMIHGESGNVKQKSVMLHTISGVTE